jgi:putative peptidoglycan lipid II flippase
VLRLAAAGLVMAVVLWLADAPVRALVAGRAFQHELALGLFALIGAVVYGAMVVALFGRRWFAAFKARPKTAPPPPVDINC